MNRLERVLGYPFYHTGVLADRILKWKNPGSFFFFFPQNVVNATVHGAPRSRDDLLGDPAAGIDQRIKPVVGVDEFFVSNRFNARGDLRTHRLESLHAT